uniref:Uncharacterized protein n=1 Tax=Steinernema glaseri TaxID=37863 RepID=A0A1I7YCF4_9BILA
MGSPTYRISDCRELTHKPWCARVINVTGSLCSRSKTLFLRSKTVTVGAKTGAIFSHGLCDKRKRTHRKEVKTDDMATGSSFQCRITYAEKEEVGVGNVAVESSRYENMKYENCSDMKIQTSFFFEYTKAASDLSTQLILFFKKKQVNKKLVRLPQRRKNSDHEFKGSELSF